MRALVLTLLFMSSVAPADEPLHVDIAAPLHNGKRIVQFGPGRRVPVVITNVGTTPIRLWSEAYSWGYAALSFELIDDAGKVVAITKLPIAWDKNFPDFVEVPAHEPMVLDEELAPLVWQLPRVPSGHVRMRAVYRVVPDEQSNKLRVWTGEVRSTTYDFQLVR